MAAARVNRMAVACADRLGTERGQEWTGGTTIVGVDGWVAAETRAPGLVISRRRSRARAGQALTELADAFADRRPELYGAVTERVTGARVIVRLGLRPWTTRST